MRDKQVMLVVPDGSAVDAGKNPPPDQVARVVEFETPAQILCDGNMNASIKYRKAYFDLHSTGFDDKEAASIHLYFRIVGPPAHQRVFIGLRIRLPQIVDGKESDQATIPLKWTNQPQSFVVGVHLTVRQKAKNNADAPPVVDARLSRSDGKIPCRPFRPRSGWNIPACLSRSTQLHRWVMNSGPTSRYFIQRVRLATLV